MAYPGNGQNWGQQQQPSSYQGLGYYQQPGEPPPRKPKNLVMIFSIIAIVLIVGAVVTIVLLNRDSGSPSANNNTTTPPATPSSSTSVPKLPSSSLPKPSGTQGNGLTPRNAGWTVIKNDKAKLLYEIPPSWKPLPDASLTPSATPDVTMYYPAGVGDYQCQGKGYNRGGIGAGTVPKGDMGQLAAKLANSFGADFYSSGNGVPTAGAPQTVTSVQDASGKPLNAVQVDATVTASGNPCLATKGKVSVLVIDNGTSNYQFMVVNGDVEGGPADQPPPPDADLRKIMDSVREYPGA